MTTNAHYEMIPQSAKNIVSIPSVEVMHVSVLTPGHLRRLLNESGLTASIFCEDYSYNILSFLTRKWWGREIIVVDRKKENA